MSNIKHGCLLFPSNAHKGRGGSREEVEEKYRGHRGTCCNTKYLFCHTMWREWRGRRRRRVRGEEKTIRSLMMESRREGEDEEVAVARYQKQVSPCPGETAGDWLLGQPRWRSHACRGGCSLGAANLRATATYGQAVVYPSPDLSLEPRGPSPVSRCLCFCPLPSRLVTVPPASFSASGWVLAQDWSLMTMRWTMSPCTPFALPQQEDCPRRVCSQHASQPKQGTTSPASSQRHATHLSLISTTEHFDIQIVFTPVSMSRPVLAYGSTMSFLQADPSCHVRLGLHRVSLDGAVQGVSFMHARAIGDDRLLALL